MKKNLSNPYPVPLLEPRINLVTLIDNAIADGESVNVVRATLIDLNTSQPIPLAKINFQVNYNAFFYDTRTQYTTDTTNLAGEAYASLANMAAETVTVVANYASHSPVNFVTFLPSAEYEIILDPLPEPVLAEIGYAVIISGRVLYRGSPLAGITRLIRYTDPVGERWINTSITDTQGKFDFRMQAVIPGTYYLTVTAVINEVLEITTPTQLIYFLNRIPGRDYQINLSVTSANNFPDSLARWELSITHANSNLPPPTTNNRIIIERTWPLAQPVM